MTHRAKLSPKKQEAIEALLVEPTAAAAALAAGVAPSVLRRWMNKDAEFGEVYRAAKRAAHRHARRRLAQGFILAVKSILQLMYHGKRAATRLKAARDILRLAREGIEIEDFAAEVADAERLLRASVHGGTQETRGHGAKRPRLEEKAITALLTERSVTGAARVAGVARQTLDGWLAQPAFLARIAATAGAVFGEGLMLAQQREDDAVTVIRNLSTDKTIPEETRSQADDYITREATAQTIEDLETHTGQMEAAAGDAGGSEPAQRWKILGRNLCQRLQRLKAALSPANWTGKSEFVYVHAEDGRATGWVSVPGPEGGQLVLVPPPGSKAGDAVPAEVAAR